MTDIKPNARALMDEVKREHPTLSDHMLAVFAAQRAIERHEAFKQEVSGVMTYIKALYPTLPRNFNRFIIPKPDPLVAVIKAMQAEPTTYVTSEVYANRINAALDALGFEIREKGQ
jgi:hypothetical protein